MVLPIQQVPTPIPTAAGRRPDSILLETRHARHGRHLAPLKRHLSVPPAPASTSDPAAVRAHGKLTPEGALDIDVLAAVVVMLRFRLEEPLLGLALALLQGTHLVVQAGHVALRLDHEGAVLAHFCVQGLQHRGEDGRGGHSLDGGAAHHARGRGQGLGRDWTAGIVPGEVVLVVVLLLLRRHGQGWRTSVVCVGAVVGVGVAVAAGL